MSGKCKSTLRVKFDGKSRTGFQGQGLVVVLVLHIFRCVFVYHSLLDLSINSVGLGEDNMDANVDKPNFSLAKRCIHLQE